MELKNKNLVIGGISGGIGKALARAATDNGMKVAGFARSEKALASLSDELDGIETTICDATDPDSVDAAFDTLADKLGRIDAYVHAIGSILLKPAASTSNDDWRGTLATNLDSAFYCLRPAVKHMQKTGGKILFFSTVAARIGVANHEAIAAAKGGIEAMARSAAATYASRGIRINTIAPSLVDTPLSAAITGNEQALEVSKKMHPTGSIGTADNIVGICRYLLSPDGDWATGQVFTIDGGMSAIVPKPRV